MLASVFFRDIPQQFLDIIRVTYNWYNCDCEIKLTGIPPHIVILAYMKELKKRFFDIRDNIRHDLTGIMDERGMGNSKYHLDQITEAINRSSSRMKN